MNININGKLLIQFIVNKTIYKTIETYIFIVKLFRPTMKLFHINHAIRRGNTKSLPVCHICKTFIRYEYYELTHV